MTRAIVLIGLAALPLGAQAQQDFDYTFVEGSYVSSEMDVGPFDVDGDGIALRGSVAMSDVWHFFGEYTTQDFDFDIDTTLWSIGAGLNHELQPNLDFVGELGWVNFEVESGGVSDDDDGLGLSAGLRYRATDKVEVEGMVNYLNLDDSNTSLALRGRYFFNPSFALTGGLVLDDSDTGWSVGLRANFGR